MFYAQFVLAKKGPLSKIWLAAHWERKLSKAQIFETDVQSAVDEIITPKTKLSLRTTGHLLLGIVRIYSKKAKYVLADCNEAFIKIKMAFRPGTAGEMQLVDKRDRGNSETDLLEDLDTMMPDLSAFDYAPGPAQIQQSRIDDITLQEDNFDTRSLRDHNFLTDDMNDFGECDSNFDEEFERTRRNFEMFQQSTSHGSGIEVERRSVTYMEDGESLIGGHTRAGSDRFDEEDFGMGAGADDEFEQQYAQLMNGERMEVDEPHAAEALGSTTGVSASPLPSERAVGRPKRRRKLIVDENTTISGEEMKHNLADYSDTVQPLDLAPPTKRLMKLKETGLAERIFNLPATDLFVNDHFLHFYQSHLIPEAKKDPNAPTAEDIRRTLNLTDGTDEDYENDDPNQLPEMSLEQLLQEDDFGELPLDEPEEPAAAEENGVENGKDERRGKRRSGQDKTNEEEDEDEEAEEDEHVFSKRTLNVLNSIVHRLRINDNQIVLDDLLTKGSTNKSVAQKFYALLELHKSQAIRIDQNEAYGPIVIEPGVQMDEFAGQS
ncbi:Rad21 / Rec8 like protein [Aphelenchoides fujianensis]|nr:Rad21 / Rec8 like protein [Aphelenchoides fujianensis]